MGAQELILIRMTRQDRLGVMHRFWNEESGLEISEYAIMMGVIVVALLVAAFALQDRINATFERVAAAIDGAEGTLTPNGVVSQDGGHGKGSLLSRIVVWLQRASEPPGSSEPEG